LNEPDAIDVFVPAEFYVTVPVVTSEAHDEVRREEVVVSTVDEPRAEGEVLVAGEPGTVIIERANSLIGIRTQVAVNLRK
jgi:hypothetical protein